MANTQYWVMVNRVLSEAGQDSIPDSTTFGNNALLTKVQYQAKLSVSKVHQRIMRNVRAWWLKQVFTITTVAWNGLQGSSSNNTYPIDPSTSPENIVEHSFVNATANMGSGEIRYQNFEQHQRQYPQGEFVSSRPTRWLLLPTYGPSVVTSVQGNIAFSPPPDRAYTITYEAYLDPYMLVNATDYLQLPPKYEDIFIEYAREWLEISLSEGKAPQIDEFLEPLFVNLRMLSKGPTEDTPHVSLGGMRIGGLSKGRAIRSVWDWYPSDQVT